MKIPFLRLVAIALFQNFAFASNPDLDAPELKLGISATQEPSVKSDKFKRKDIFNALEQANDYLEKQNSNEEYFIQKAEYDDHDYCWRIISLSSKGNYLISVFDNGVIMWSPHKDTNAYTARELMELKCKYLKQGMSHQEVDEHFGDIKFVFRKSGGPMGHVHDIYFFRGFNLILYFDYRGAEKEFEEGREDKGKLTEWEFIDTSKSKSVEQDATIKP